MPGPLDAARFDDRSTDVTVDGSSSDVLGAVVLERGFAGTVRLGRDLSITRSLVIAGGTLAQGSHRLSVARLEQTGGRLEGGTGHLQIDGAAAVSGGTLETPCATARIRTLEIRAPGVVRVGENGRLELIGDGNPLLGDGLLDTTTNRPTSVEFTGRTTMDVPLATSSPLRRLPRGRSDVEAFNGAHGRAALAGSRRPLAFGDRETILNLDPGENVALASAVDSVAGLAYFVFSGYPAPSPAEIVKIRTSDFTRVGILTLAQGESDIRSAVLDAAGGFAYFGLYANPGSIVKVRLSDFSRVGSLPLNPGEDYLKAAAIDPASGFAYFGTFTIPGSIVKVRLSDFTRVGAIMLDPGEDLVVTGAIDPLGGFAYFATGQAVVKVRLSDFSRVGSLPIDPSDGFITTSVIEPGGAYAYFGTDSNQGTVIKVRLSDLTETGRISFPPAEGGLRASAIDATGQYAYFGANTIPGVVVRVRLSDFTRLDVLALGTNENFVSSVVLDSATGNLFVSAFAPPGKIVRVRLSDFSRVDALTLRNGEDFLLSSAIDTTAGFAYFGTFTRPGFVVKVRLSDFTRVAALTLGPGEDALTSAVIDPAAGFAYFGTYTDPGVIVKVRLSDFTRVGATTLSPGESYLFSASIDSGAGFAYFGVDTSRLPLDSPGLLVKVRLSDLAKVRTLDVTGGPGSVFCSVIDPPAGFAYVGATAPLSTVVKVRLSDFSRAASLPLPDLSIFPSSAVIDTIAGFAFFGGYDDPAVVARVRLSDFTRDGVLTLPNGEGWLASAVIDPAAGFAYFGTDSSPGRVIKVRLSDVTRAGALAFPTDVGSPTALGTRFLTSAVVDTVAEFAYFGTNTRPSRIARVDLSTVGAATATVSGGAVTCPGSTNTIRVYLSGTPPWSVTWSDGVVQTGVLTSPAWRNVAPTAPVTYTVSSVSDANGTGTASGGAAFAFLPVPPAPTITAPAAAFPGASGLTASVPYHVGSWYNWLSTGGIKTSVLASNSITFTAALSGPTELFVQEFGPCPSPMASALVAVAAATPPLNLHTLPPCRVFDTRSSSGPEAASPALASDGDRIFDTTGRCSIPSSATALSANVTVTQPAAAGWLILFAGNEPAPSSANTISFAPGQTRASSAIVRLGSGSRTIGVQNNSPGTVHFILDVNGYFE